MSSLQQELKVLHRMQKTEMSLRYGIQDGVHRQRQAISYGLHMNWKKKRYWMHFVICQDREQQTDRTMVVNEYRVEVSTDGSTWTTVSTGNWEDSQDWKLAEFTEPVVAKYVRLTGVHTYGSSAANVDKYMSAAEIRLRMAESKTDIADAANGVTVTARIQSKLQKQMQKIRSCSIFLIL